MLTAVPDHRAGSEQYLDRRRGNARNDLDSRRVAHGRDLRQNSVHRTCGLWRGGLAVDARFGAIEGRGLQGAGTGGRKRMAGVRQRGRILVDGGDAPLPGGQLLDLGRDAAQGHWVEQHAGRAHMLDVHLHTHASYQAKSNNHISVYMHLSSPALAQ